METDNYKLFSYINSQRKPAYGKINQRARAQVSPLSIIAATQMKMSFVPYMLFLKQNEFALEMIRDYPQKFTFYKSDFDAANHFKQPKVLSALFKYGIFLVDDKQPFFDPTKKIFAKLESQ
jgi:hypothetical protein